MIERQTTWKNWILRKKQVTLTTWKFRLLVLFVILSPLYLTYPAWLVAFGDTLAHEDELEQADLLLLENFSTDYAVFETAENLVRSGYSSQVLVPVRTDEGSIEADTVEEGFVEVMSRAARIDQYEILPVQHVEPISLNVAHQIADFLQDKRIRSVIVVAPRFRSARSYLVYRNVLTPLGIRVQCVAAATSTARDNWWHTHHGLQDVFLQFFKLLYYRFWLL